MAHLCSKSKMEAPMKIRGNLQCVRDHRIFCFGCLHSTFCVSMRYTFSNYLSTSIQVFYYTKVCDYPSTSGDAPEHQLLSRKHIYSSCILHGLVYYRVRTYRISSGKMCVTPFNFYITLQIVGYITQPLTIQIRPAGRTVSGCIA